MKNLYKILLAVLFVFSTGISKADFVSVNTAQTAATKYLFLKGETNSLTLVHTEYVFITEMFYVFDITGGGHIIISADDRVKPIMAYAPDENYVINSDNPGFDFWKYSYEQYFIDSVISITPTTRKLNDWDLFTNPSNNQSIVMITVGPLMNSIWNQNRPCENSLVIANTAAGVPVGCVATAYGQIMNYYQHPYQGNGSSSYVEPANFNSNGVQTTASYGTLTVNHSSNQFDWDNMSQSTNALGTFCTTGDDVAQLLYDLGVSFSMNYSPGSSGTNTANAGIDLIDHFGFDDDVTYDLNSNYSTQNAWENMLQGELDASRPMVYRGQRSCSTAANPTCVAGHAWVCDGYDITGTAETFHFNWGWGGNQGWYASPMNQTVGSGSTTGSTNTNNYNLNNAVVRSLFPGTDLAPNMSQTVTLTGTNTLTLNHEMINDYGNDPGESSDARCNPYTVKYYASTNPYISTSDVYLGQLTDPNGIPGNGASQAFSFSFTPANFSAAPGNYWIGWMYDANDDVWERDESNNIWYYGGSQVYFPGQPGCMNPIACNYDANADYDDGSCTYVDNPSVDLTNGIWTLEWDVGCNGISSSSVMTFNSNGTATFASGSSVDWSMCGNTYTHVYSNGTLYTGTYANGIISGTLVLSSGGTGCFTLTLEVLGCTDPIASNYNPAANQDDGSCVYPPANDNCATAEAIACGGSATGSTVNATASGLGGSTSTGQDIWYSITGTGDIFTVSLCGSSFDTYLRVYDACGGTQVAYNDDDCGWQSEVTFTSVAGVDYKISCGGYSSFTGTVAISVTCATIPCTVAPYSENFDAGIGTITNNGWVLDAGGTPSTSTGPSDDMTGGGNYMYYETSSGYLDTVTISTECLDISGLSNPCLSFYYHMYGATMGTLDVNVNGTSVWSLSGDQGNQWNISQVSLTSFIGNDITITFTGTYGGGYTGDMAIDNISVDECVTLGCTDPTASNYHPNAVVDDGSCCYDNWVTLDMNDSYGDGWNGNTWTATGGTNTYGPFTLASGSSGSESFCMTDDCYDIVCDFGSWQSEVSWTLTDASGTVITSGGAPYNAQSAVGSASCGPTCGAITGVNLTDVIHDRATFNWDDMNSATCDVDQIRIRYSDDGGSTYSTKTMGAPVGNNAPALNTSKRVLNLTASTAYVYDFKIWYQDGTVVSWHAGGTFTTADPCLNVTNVTATPTSQVGQANFCWTAPSSPYSFVRLKYREDVPGSSFSNIGGMGVMAPALCKTKNGITSGLTYRVMWRAWCNPNGGPYRSAGWDGPTIWTQTAPIRVEGGTTINNLDVYPNPSRDIFNVTFTSEDVQNLEVRIINVIGEVVYTENLDQFVGQYTKQVDLATYTKGVYLLEITTDNGIINKKLILQ